MCVMDKQTCVTDKQTCVTDKQTYEMDGQTNICDRQTNICDGQTNIYPILKKVSKIFFVSNHAQFFWNSLGHDGSIGILSAKI